MTCPTVQFNQDKSDVMTRFEAATSRTTTHFFVFCIVFLTYYRFQGALFNDNSDKSISPKHHVLLVASSLAISSAFVAVLDNCDAPVDILYTNEINFVLIPTIFTVCVISLIISRYHDKIKFSATSGILLLALVAVYPFASRHAFKNCAHNKSSFVLDMLFYPIIILLSLTVTKKILLVSLILAVVAKLPIDIAGTFSNKYVVYVHNYTSASFTIHKRQSSDTTDTGLKAGTLFLGSDGKIIQKNVKDFEKQTKTIDVRNHQKIVMDSAEFNLGFLFTDKSLFQSEKYETHDLLKYRVYTNVHSEPIANRGEELKNENTLLMRFIANKSYNNGKTIPISDVHIYIHERETDLPDHVRDVDHYNKHKTNIVLRKPSTSDDIPYLRSIHPFQDGDNVNGKIFKKISESANTAFVEYVFTDEENIEEIKIKSFFNFDGFKFGYTNQWVYFGFIVGLFVFLVWRLKNNKEYLERLAPPSTGTLMSTRPAQLRTNGSTVASP